MHIHEFWISSSEEKDEIFLELDPLIIIIKTLIKKTPPAVIKLTYILHKQHGPESIFGTINHFDFITFEWQLLQLNINAFINRFMILQNILCIKLTAACTPILDKSDN